MTDDVTPSEPVVSIVRQIDGEAVVVRGRLVARQPSSLTVQLDTEHQLPSGVALASLTNVSGAPVATPLGFLNTPGAALSRSGTISLAQAWG